MSDTDPRLLHLSGTDNIVVLTATLHKGDTVQLGGQMVVMPQTLGIGHKLASQPIQAGRDVLKYGLPIGFAAEDIAVGDHVHIHNLTSRYTTIEVME